ncbi:unnamed protein product, partial [Pylaiella littoralis]
GGATSHTGIAAAGEPGGSGEGGRRLHAGRGSHDRESEGARSAVVCSASHPQRRAPLLLDRPSRTSAASQDYHDHGRRHGAESSSTRRRDASGRPPFRRSWSRERAQRPHHVYQLAPAGARREQRALSGRYQQVPKGPGRECGGRSGTGPQLHG